MIQTMQTFDPVCFDAFSRLLAQPDGRLLIRGLFSRVDGVPRQGLARLQADGALDQSFDPGSGAESGSIATVVVQTNGQMEKLGAIYDSAPYGYVVPKKDMAFADALAGALKALIKDGTYKKILDAWYVGDGAMSNPQVNPPATS